MHKFLVRLCCFSALFWQLLYADTLIPRQKLFAPQQIKQLVLSYDGKKIFGIKLLNGVDNLCEYDLATGKTKFLTKFKSNGVSYLYRLHNKHHFCFFREREGSELSDLYLFDCRNKHFKRLAKELTGGVSIIAASKKYPNEILVQSNSHDARYCDVYRLNVVTGKLRLIFKNEKFRQFIADDELNLVIACKYQDNGDLDIYHYENDAWKIYDTILAENFNSVAFEIRKKTIYMLSPVGRDKCALYQIDWQKHTRKLLYANNKAEIVEFFYNKLTSKPGAVQLYYDKPLWHALDPVWQKDFDYLEKQGLAGFYPISSSENSDVWLVANYSVDKPTEFYLYRRLPQRKLQFLFSANPDLQNVALPKRETKFIRTRDGLTLVCYLTLPKDFGNKPVPLVLYVHGGPRERDDWGYDANHQWLANRGYAVLSVNFRGSSGFGKAFLNAGNREWGRKMQNDLVDAVKWAVRQKIADSKKIAIVGASYGGYAALCGLTFTPGLFCCGVSINGPSDLLAFIYHTPPEWHAEQADIRRFIGDITSPNECKRLAAVSPANFVERIKAPLLIMQSARDARVAKQDTDRLVERLFKVKNNFEYVVFPELAHLYNEQANIAIKVFVEQFLAKHLGGRCEEAGNDLKGIEFTRVK